MSKLYLFHHLIRFNFKLIINKVYKKLKLLGEEQAPEAHIRLQLEQMSL